MVAKKIFLVYFCTVLNSLSRILAEISWKQRLVHDNNESFFFLNTDVDAINLKSLGVNWKSLNTVNC